MTSPVADTLERCEAVVIARDGFPIDDAGAGAQAGERLDDQRDTAGAALGRSYSEPPRSDYV
jgi:hypothetical protein